MSRPASRQPTELELQILKILWAAGPQTVASTQDGLADAGRKLAAGSVATTLNIMVEKGQVTRQKDGRSFRYTPVGTADEGRHGIIRDVLNRVFDGSAYALVNSVIDATNLTDEEIERLRSLLKDRPLDSESNP